jgi:hypothetical protein
MREKPSKEKSSSIVEDAQELANIYYNTIHLINIRDYN